MNLEGYLKPYKTFRDPVQMDIKLTRLESEIVDTPDFQRLRGIRQLGTTYLLYPGALHTRFDHTLGAVAQAQRMIDAINANPYSASIEDDEIRVVARLATLLHDITHIPFGHTLEDEARLYSRHDEPARFEAHLGPGTVIGDIMVRNLGKEVGDRVVKVLTAKKEEQIALLGADAVIADIVGNTICADLLDYLKRDVYFTGLEETYERRFLDYLYVPTDGEYQNRLVLRLHKRSTGRMRSDIASGALSLLRLRYRLAESVYYHHSKMCTSAMIAAAVQKSPFGDDRDALYRYGDDGLVAAIEGNKDRSAGSEIANCLRLRRLYKPVYLVGYARPTMGDPKYEKTQRLVDQFNKDLQTAKHNRAKVEEELELAYGLPAGSVIIYCPHADMQLKAAKALVAWQDGLILPLEDSPDESYRQEVRLINERHKALWKFIVYVHPDHVHVKDELGCACARRFELQNELPGARLFPVSAAQEGVERWGRCHPESAMTVIERDGLARRFESSDGERFPSDADIAEALTALRRSGDEMLAALDAWRRGPYGWLECPGLGEVITSRSAVEELRLERQLDLCSPSGIGQLNLMLHLQRLAIGAKGKTAGVVRDNLALIRDSIENEPALVYELASENKPTDGKRRRGRTEDEAPDPQADAATAVERAFAEVVKRKRGKLL